MKSINLITALQVLQRKAEETARATKKLKELLESRKVAAKRETTGKYLNETIFHNLFLPACSDFIFSSLFVSAQPKGQNRSGQVTTFFSV